MKLSVIIPVYNAAAFIPRALDSIYSQGMKEDDFEVICVDDCSPDNSYEVMTSYLYEGYHPENLIILRHSVNKRQGGGRNTGLRAARGKWILFMDPDDFFYPGTLNKLLEEAEKEPKLDTILFDRKRGDGTFENAKDDLSSLNLDTHTMTGEEFLLTNPVSGAVWNYLYRRDHLLATGILFEENVFFEDTDFMMNYLVHAKAIRFLPLVVYYYWLSNPDQTTQNIDKDQVKMMDHICLWYRVYKVAIEEKSRNLAASNVIMDLAKRSFRSYIKRYSCRISFRNLLTAFRRYHLTEPTGDGLFDFINRHPLIAAIIMKPFFSVELYIRKCLKMVLPESCIRFLKAKLRR